MGDNFCAYCAEQGIYVLGVERLRVLLFGDWVCVWLCGGCLAAVDLGAVLYSRPVVVRQSDKIFLDNRGAK